MTSTLIKYNVILIVLCIGITLIHNSSEVKKDVILYYNHLSPQCRSVLLTLGAFDLEITLIPIDLLNGEQLPEKLREINSLHTVPVLEDGDFVLSESNAIIVYLVQQYGGSDHSLYPKDLKIQAQVNQILNFESRTLYPAIKNLYMNIHFIII
ncbi:glutathione S-transferase 1-1 isoform X2 [Acyrthosiphon pisum]|uniref:GST N-terminal domain-containing protein n=1 Tax=Acyrthosiphon pisum TaxID=7029 RepID=A0A8R2D5G3_ACYPI|nr:glutathione S-transferase 1-1 isoform X2 [Acyrthosiphon pisum]|eukprot:XP_016662287.1 PREDICTED: glutathione S-transferase 1-1-like isoform X2 [Acyrthosiphon pisum]